MSSGKGPKHIYALERKLYYYYYHFGGHWENKNWKKWQQNSLNNHARVYKLNDFYFPSVETRNTSSEARNYKITFRNYKSLPFKFSKFIKDMKAMELLQAVLTSEASLERNRRPRMSEQARVILMTSNHGYNVHPVVSSYQLVISFRSATTELVPLFC